MNAPPEKPGEKEQDKPAQPAAEKTLKTGLKSVPRGKIYEKPLDLIGGTPMMRLPRFCKKYEIKADILAKLEFANPYASVKDRSVLAMFEAAEAAGDITPDKTVLIEPASGNSGVSMAAIAAVKGYRLILTLPENVSYDRQKLLAYYGAEVHATPANKGMKGAVEKAKSLTEQHGENAYSFNQFENKAALAVHEQTTAEEIWADTGGKVDILVAGVGTGATLMGTLQGLRKKNKKLKAYAVEPKESAVLSEGEPAQHKISGIGVGFVPPLMDVSVINGIVRVESARALEITRELARLEGLPCGISSGAALAGAIDVARADGNEDKTIAVILPSFVERYLSTELFQPF